MKTLNEWLETGLLTNLHEDEYHNVVCLFNQALLESSTFENFTDDKEELQNLIVPLVRRVYDELKRKCENGSEEFKDLLKYINTYHIALSLYGRRGLFVVIRMTFPFIDAECEVLNLITHDIVNSYMISYKGLKTAAQDDIKADIHPTFKMWRNLQKAKLETPIYDDFPF